MQNSQQKARQGGFAMIMVLCVGALFVALATALLFAASLLVANANRQLTEQEVYGLASTFSARLDTELTTFDKATAPTTSFGYLANDYLHLYTAATEPITFDCTNDLSTLDGAEKLSVTLSKREGDTDLFTDGEVVTLGSDPSSELASANNEETVVDYYLNVSVTAELKDQSFTYTQSYECESRYTLYYTLEGHGVTQYTYNAATQAFDPTVGTSVSLADAKEKEITKHCKTGSTEPTAVHFVNRSVNTDDGEGSP